MVFHYSPIILTRRRPEIKKSSDLGDYRCGESIKCQRAVLGNVPKTAGLGMTRVGWGRFYLPPSCFIAHFHTLLGLRLRWFGMDLLFIPGMFLKDQPICFRRFLKLRTGMT